jgi:hypothetical protein
MRAHIRRLGHIFGCQKADYRPIKEATPFRLSSIIRQQNRRSPIKQRFVDHPSAKFQPPEGAKLLHGNSFASESISQDMASRPIGWLTPGL